MSNADVNPELELGEVVTPEAPTDEEAAIEAQARRMGWRPKEEYNKAPDRWVDAKTFVDRGMTELPVLRDRYRKLDGQFTTMSSKLTETERTIKDQGVVINELRELARNAEDRAYIRAARELSQREREAVASADTAAFDALQRERQDLEATRPRATAEPVPVRPVAPAAPQAPAAPPPEVDQWIRENPWFTTDPTLNQVAIAFDAEVKREHPEWSVTEQLAEAKARVVNRFPEKFGNPRRAAAPAVLTSNNSPAPKKGKSIKDLPKEYQDAFARFQRQMPGYTEAEYLKTLGEI